MVQESYDPWYPKPLLDPAAVENLISNMQPGDKVLYHVGYLVHDREYDRAIHLVAEAFMAAATSIGRPYRIDSQFTGEALVRRYPGRGLGMVYQKRRVEGGGFEYWFIRTEGPAPLPSSLRGRI